MVPLAGRIQHYVERLVRARSEIFEEHNRKRPAPSEPTDGLDAAKRARLGAGAHNPLTQHLVIPPLPPGPTSFAQLFTITNDQGLSSFDVTQLPVDMVMKIALPVLYRLDSNALNEAIDVRIIPFMSAIGADAQPLGHSRALSVVQYAAATSCCH